MSKFIRIVKYCWFVFIFSRRERLLKRLGLLLAILALGYGIALTILFASHCITCLTHSVHTTKWFWLPVTYLLIIYEMHAGQAQAEGQEMEAASL